MTLAKKEAPETETMHFPHLPIKVLIGAVLGIISGVVFGDYNRIFTPFGSAYTLLLQVVVYPYLICSILSGLGKLTWKSDSRLLTQGIKIYLLLLIIVFLTIYLLSRGLPNITHTIVPSHPISSDLLDIIIPSNIFSALANNYVPAVVVFCIIFATVLQGTKNKMKLINMLDIISTTCLRFWNWLVTLAPYAVFFILAETAGTIQFSQLVELSNYLVLFFSGTLLLAFWILPVLLAAITNQSYISILKKLKPALIISAATTLSVAALPYIKKITNEMLEEHGAKIDYEKNIVNTAVSLSYPFGQLGNMFVSLFMLFTALYFNHPISSYEKLFLPYISYISSLGSPSTIVNAVAFLSKWLQLPKDTVVLYFGIVPLVRYGQVLASVVGIAYLTIAVSFSFFNLIQINYKKIIFNLLAFFLVIFLIATLTINLTEDPNIKIYQRLNSLRLDKNIIQNTKAVVYTRYDVNTNAPLISQDSLYQIQKSGVLRVGYNADMRPFVFFNDYNELVGYDVDIIYALAQSLKVEIIFIPFEWDNLVNDIVNNRFDLAIGGIYVTISRLQEVNFTQPYLQSPLSFIVRKGQQHNFTDGDKIRAMQGLRIGVFEDPVLIPIAKNNFPNAQIVVLPNYQSKTIANAFAKNEIDAALWSLAQTDVWALGHPNYISVVPSKVGAPFLMGYMVNKKSVDFMRYLNYWLQLEKFNNFQQNLYNRWFLVGVNKDLPPRWSLLNVLLNKMQK